MLADKMAKCLMFADLIFVENKITLIQKKKNQCSTCMHLEELVEHVPQS